MNFILANGAVVRVLISVRKQANPEQKHLLYDFQPKDSFIQKEIEEDFTPIEFLKGMIRGDRLQKYTKTRMKRHVESSDPNISIELQELYTGPKYNGYVFKVTNNSRSSNYIVDLTQLKIGHPDTARVSHVKSKNLKPANTSENSTLVHVVASSTTTYYNLNLPFKKYSPSKK